MKDITIHTVESNLGYKCVLVDANVCEFEKAIQSEDNEDVILYLKLWILCYECDEYEDIIDTWRRKAWIGVKCDDPSDVEVRQLCKGYLETVDFLKRYNVKTEGFFDIILDELSPVVRG